MIEIHVPSFPESIQEGVLTHWLFASLDSVKKGDLLAEIETDKVVLEVYAENSGILSILKESGTSIKSLELIAKIDETQTEVKDSPQKKLSSNPKKEILDEPYVVLSSPSARKKAREQVLSSASPLEFLPAKKSEFNHEIKLETRPQERREPMGRFRKTIASRLVEAQHTAAILSTFNEVDISEIKRIRKKHGDAFEKKYGIRLGVMSFFIKASVLALQKFPKVNAFIEGEEIVYHDYQNIGVAVSSSKGLVVPVLKNVEKMDIPSIESFIQDYRNQAKEGKLLLDDLLGATFTISNGGVFGSLLSTPILIPPQSAILGMHAIKDRPIAKDGEVVIAPMMYLALSYDHRLLDGKDAVLFLKEIKATLESPERLFLNL